MKKYIFIIQLLLFYMIFNNGFSQTVELQNPLPTSNDLLKVHFFSDGDDGLAIGSNGTVLKSQDGGITWDRLNFNDKIREDFCDFSFINDSTGFMVSSGHVYKTVNRGETWDTLNFNKQLYSVGLKTVFFLNENMGWCAGGAKMTYKTNNGGLSWDSVYCGTTSIAQDIPNMVLSIHFTDSLTGWCGGNFNALLKTTDGGNSWAVNEIIPNLITDIYFDESGNGYVTENFHPDLFYWMHKTNNNGVTWDAYRIDVNDVRTNAYSISIINGKHIWVVGDYLYEARILHSSDYGQTFHVQFQDSLTYSFQGCYFADTLNGLVVGDNGVIFKTEDGGNNWLEVSRSVSFDINYKTIEFIDSLNGFAGGGGANRLIKTNDGGLTWTNITSSLPPFSIKDIFFLDNNIGWMCGVGNLICKTENGGSVWQEINLDIPNYTLHSIFFLNENLGWICGNNSIYKTVNGGETWDEQKIENEDEFESYIEIFFHNENEGWINTFHNEIYKTLDGGETWSKEVENAFYLSFIDDSIGWYIDAENFIMYKTINKGETWEPKDNFSDFFRYHFYDNLHGVGVSNDTVYKTNNGGESWDYVEMDFPLESTIRDIKYVTGNHAWCCGDNGCIYHISNLGSSGIAKLRITTEPLIYPNPVEDILHINKGYIFNKVEIYSTKGDIVKSIITKNNDISISELSAGMYLIKIYLNSHNYKTFKFFKK